MSQNDWVIKQFLKQNIMLKNILNLNGAQQLSKNEQKVVNGGLPAYRLCCDVNGGPSYSTTKSCKIGFYECTP
jgi:hypothetical protein